MGFSFYSIRRSLYRNNRILRKFWFWVLFVRRNNYLPNFKSPKTYNEKINFRKNNPKHDLFSICSDKVSAKEWCANIIGNDYIIPNYFVGDSINKSIVKKVLRDKGDCLLKASHNSGPVYLLESNATEEEIESACRDINRQLLVDYGSLKNEQWYSKIKPKVLIEKRLYPQDGEADIRDYKFHVFKQNDGSQTVVLHVDFDRSSNHNRTFFDENLNWLPFSIKYPSIRTSIDRPKNYDKMLELSKLLAKPFSYVRVDLYNVDGEIYFGEMTFAHESGNGPFNMYAFDLWMGNLWQGDPSY